VVFHAGTGFSGGKVVSAGGRVLGVTGRGVDISAATRNAYEAVAKIGWEGCWYRKDIAHRALSRGR
ncbi:MAG: phosphoribosylamine--glycine ligase, partial [Victivallales bacterium]|nr:phosphoribosylamine--glycine ligase [Victivallales bacterium]